MWITWHDSCDLWTLGGRICLSLQDLARWTCIHEEMTCSDIHGGFRAQGWMERPHVWGKLVIITCIVKKKVVAFGGTLAWLGDQLLSLSTWMLAFGGLDITLIVHDVTRA